MSFGDEPGLLEAQAKAGLSIFGCDAFEVFGDSLLSDRFNVTVLQGPLTSRKGRFNSYLNAPALGQVWDKIFADGRYLHFDWTVKVDADAVLFPDRARRVLSTACNEDPCEALAMNDCGFVWGPATDLVPGPIQALSRAAAKKFAQNVSTCRKHINMSALEEDIFLSDCLDYLRIGFGSPVGFVKNNDCDAGLDAMPIFRKVKRFYERTRMSTFFTCDCCFAAFHPFKTTDEWVWCWWWANNAHLTWDMRLLLFLLLPSSYCLVLCAFARACRVARNSARSPELFLPQSVLASESGKAMQESEEDEIQAFLE